MIVGMVVATLLAGAAGDSGRQSGVTLSRVLERHTVEWMQIDGVVGTAEGEKRGKPCILILVERKSPKLMKLLPRSVEGYPVVLKEVGRVKPLNRR